jgi:hypothetical protein
LQGRGHEERATGRRLTPFSTFTMANPATLFGAAVASTNASNGAARPATVVIANSEVKESGLIPISGQPMSVLASPAGFEPAFWP